MKEYPREKLLKFSERLFEETSQYSQTMRMLHRIWFRNILYYMGEQWFEWLRSTGSFRKIMPTKFTPTPVANIIRDYVRSMKGLILNKDYSVSIWPNSNDQDDRDAAEMAGNFLRWMDAQNDEEGLDEKEKLVVWMIICGLSFARTFASMENGEWAVGKDGSINSKSNVETVTLNPFSVVWDSVGDKWKSKRCVGYKSLRPREWIEDTFKTLIAPGDVNGMAVEYERKLATMVANVSPWKGDGIGLATDVFDEDLALLKEIEFAPTKEFPKGYYAGLVGNEVVFQHDRLPIPVSDEGKWDYSITDVHYHFVPGRFVSDPGVSDLISPQNTINQIDQALEINRKGVGTPIVWLPVDAVIRRLTGYGASIIAMQYDALAAGGQKPEIARGTPLPGQVLEERAVHQQNAQDASGDPKNVLRGQAPTSQASGVLVDILRDAAEQGHLPDVERFYRAWKRIKRKELVLAQEVYTEQRMIKIPDAGNRAKILPFKGSDLRNNTDVRIELASGAASTRSGQVNLILKLTEQGFFSPEYPMDPEDRQEILRKLGLSGFGNKNSADLQRAMAENERIAGIKDPDDPNNGLAETQIEMPQEDGSIGIVKFSYLPGLFVGLWMDKSVDDPVVISDDPRFEFDEDAVHYETHRRFIVSQEFSMLDPEVQDVMLMHARSHKDRSEARQAQQEAEMAAKMQAFEAERAAGPAGSSATSPAGSPAGSPAAATPEPMESGFQPMSYEGAGPPPVQ
jgi:hypothetical protein